MKWIKKLFRAIGRFLWPKKGKWDEYRKDVTEVTALVEEKWKQQVRNAMKNTIFMPPLKDPVPGIRTDEPVRWVRMAELNAPDPSLPVVCTACGRPTSPSEIDDRLVACISCKMVYMTAEAENDPTFKET